MLEVKEKMKTAGKDEDLGRGFQARDSSRQITSDNKQKGLIIGQRGVTYGLEIRKPAENKKTLGRPEGLESRGQGLKPKSVFGDDDESSSSENEGIGGGKSHIGRMIAAQAASKQSDKKVLDMQAAALKEDASIFDYDAHYESIQESRAAPRRDEKIERKSKYIASLLHTAEERKREQDILYEKRLTKEREAEDYLYGEKEKFVTSAYRKKLEEEKLWKAEQERKKQEEERHAVEKRGHMGDFYRNLFKTNVDFMSKREMRTKEDGENGASNVEDGPTSARGEMEQPSSVQPPPTDGVTKAISPLEEPIINDIEPKIEEERPPEALLPRIPEKTTVDVHDDNKDDEQRPVQKDEKETEDAASKAERLKREREKKAQEAKERYLARKRKISSGAVL